MNSMIMDTQKKQTQKLESPEMTAAMTAVNTLVDYSPRTAGGTSCPICGTW